MTRFALRDYTLTGFCVYCMSSLIHAWESVLSFVKRSSWQQEHVERDPADWLHRFGRTSAGATTLTLVTLLVLVNALLLGWLALDEALKPTYFGRRRSHCCVLLAPDGRV